MVSTSGAAGLLSSSWVSAALKRDGSTAGIIDRMFNFKEVNEVIGTGEMLAVGNEYADK